MQTNLGRIFNLSPEKSLNNLQADLAEFQLAAAQLDSAAKQAHAVCTDLERCLCLLRPVELSDEEAGLELIKEGPPPILTDIDLGDLTTGRTIVDQLY